MNEVLAVRKTPDRAKPGTTFRKSERRVPFARLKGFRIGILLGISMVSALILPAEAVSGDFDDSPNPRAFHLFYGIAISHDQVREELLVPLRWTGVGGGILLGWDLIRQRWSFNCTLDVALSYLEEHYGNAGATLTPTLALEGYRRFEERGSVIAGIGAVFRSRINDEQLYSWDDAHLYYLASYMFGPAASLEWRCFSGGTLHFKLGIPIAGFAGRPEEERFVKQEVGNFRVYFTEPNSELRFATLPEYLGFELSAGIDLRRKRSALRLDYILDFERDTQPEPFVRFTNTVLLAHDIRLGRLK